jgi:hypothetical protein
MRDTLEEDKKFNWDGMYRALCVKDDDERIQARIKVWIPDVMPGIEPDSGQGIWARPANNPLGGRNLDATYGDDHDYQGSCMIPPKGSWLYIFFENGDPAEPRYFGACDIVTKPGADEEPSVPAECRQGGEYWKKWVPIKTRMGRTIVISDDVHDERVELTGKKRGISTPPDGDDASVYQIDTNMTTILLDERLGKEKLLIRTVKGDYLHIDIDQQMLQAYFQNDIRIQTGANLHLMATENIIVNAGGSIVQQCAMNHHTTVGMMKHTNVVLNEHQTIGQTKFLLTGQEYNRYIGTVSNEMAGQDINKIAINYNLDSAATNINSNKAFPATMTIPAIPASPSIPQLPSTILSRLPIGPIVAPSPCLGPVIPTGLRDD